MAVAGNYNVCDICKCGSNYGDEELYFGEWMQSNNITVHYFCLLLSTQLPQNGADNSGICGFLIRDIRAEIAAAAKRMCSYCNQYHASIFCEGCKDIFHLRCARTNKSLFQFYNQYATYCAKCKPLDDYQMQLLKQPPNPDTCCHICHNRMGIYTSTDWIYGPCCGNGFVHRLCMLKFAMSAGYYLKCIWCKNTEFREMIRKQGIFVPDRDASWELERDAYQDLHRGHRRCNMPKCLCPKGSDYVSLRPKDKWKLILCSLCGSFGAHNPGCIPEAAKMKKPLVEFNCDTCVNLKKKIVATNMNSTLLDTGVNTSLYVVKRSNKNVGKILPATETLNFSDDSITSEDSVITVLKQPNNSSNLTLSNANSSQMLATKTVATMPQSPIDQTEISLNDARRPSIALENHTDLLETSLHNLNISQTTVIGAVTILPTTEQNSKEKWQEFLLYEFIEPEMKCTGTIRVRVNLLDERFNGKTVDELASGKYFDERDYVERSDDIGIWRDIQNIIDDDDDAEYDDEEDNNDV